MKWILLVAVALLVGCQTETTPEVAKPSEKELNFQYNTKAFFEEVEKAFEDCEDSGYGDGKPATKQRIEWLGEKLDAIDPPAEYKSQIIKNQDLMKTLNRIRGCAMMCFLLNERSEDTVSEANELMDLIRQKYLD